MVSSHIQSNAGQKDLSVQTRIEEDGKGKSSENGFQSEGKKLSFGRGMSFSFGVPKHSFLCLRNPGT